MLFELYLEYIDGRSETTIIYVGENEQPKIYPLRDNITVSGCKPFKYKVPKHDTLPKSIIRFLNKTMIYPEGIECHPQTTLEDIIEIGGIKKDEPKVELKMVWKFESKSGGGIYTVRENMGKYKCDCMGYIRSRGNCVHVKEVKGL